MFNFKDIRAHIVIWTALIVNLFFWMCIFAWGNLSKVNDRLFICNVVVQLLVYIIICFLLVEKYHKTYLMANLSFVVMGVLLVGLVGTFLETDIWAMFMAIICGVIELRIVVHVLLFDVFVKMLLKLKSEYSNRSEIILILVILLGGAIVVILGDIRLMQSGEWI